MTTKKQTVGSRRQVWNGTAKKTSGGLIKADLMLNKNGRIVSRSKHASAKKENRLVKYGFKTKKGHFGYIKNGSKKNRKSMKGGSGLNELSPASADGSYMIKDVVPQHLGPEARALNGGSRRSKSMKGGVSYGSGVYPAEVGANNITGYLNGSGIDGQGITPGGPQTLASMAGGKKHRKHMKGGMATHMPLNPSGPLNAALNASGGKRRAKRGGSGVSILPAQLGSNPGSPLNAALNAAGGSGVSILPAQLGSNPGSPLNAALNAA